MAEKNSKGVKSTQELSKSFMEKLQKENKIHEKTKFNPFRMKDKNSEIFNKGLPFIFISSPRLNLVNENISRDSFLTYLKNVKPELLKSLNYSNAGAQSSSRPFIPILSNRFMGISLTEVQLATKEHHETFYGFKQTLPIGTVNSVAGGEITLEFEENKDVDIMHLIKAWVEYIEGVTRGYFFPSDDAKEKRYIDYTSSIYYFLLDFDAETILHYSKFTGCFPNNIPIDVFSQNATDGPEVPHVGVNFAYSYREDANPDILLDFNSITNKAQSIVSKNGGISGVEANKRTKVTIDKLYDYNLTKPYITITNPDTEDHSIKKYKLKFK